MSASNALRRGSEAAQARASVAAAATAAPTTATDTATETATSHRLRMPSTPMPHYIRPARGHARRGVRGGAKKTPTKFLEGEISAAYLPATAYISRSTFSTPLAEGSLSMFS